MERANHDPEAYFSAIFEACYGRVRAYAARRVGSQAADEVAAETFTVAWRRIEQIPSEPLPWLYGVARNIVARHHTKHARERTAQHALQHERVPVDLADSDWPELWEAWDKLGQTDREVLELIAWEELPVRDAARVLGCSPAVFSVRLHRARRHLERLLKPVPQRSAHAAHA